jgi:OmpA-OmpF porin, OOP family
MKSFCLFILCVCTLHLTAQMPKIENGKLVLDKQVTFKSGSSELTDEGKAALQSIKEFLIAKEYITKLRIEGHLGNSNAEDKNQLLTEQRSLAVAKWLVTNGIDCNRLIAVGFGSTKPVAENNNPEGKVQNRRMEFIPAELRGKAIGGMPLDGGGKVAGDPCLK